MFSLISAWINCRVNNREAGDLRRLRAHYVEKLPNTTHPKRACVPIHPPPACSNRVPYVPEIDWSSSQIAKFMGQHGAHLGPVGPMWAPWTLLSGVLTHHPAPSAAYMRQWIGSVLFQIKACRLFRAKPLPEPMLFYCQLDTWEQISVKFKS